MSSATLTTWSLEQTSPGDLTPAPVPDAVGAGELAIVRAEVPSAGFSRYLYTAVGGDIEWIDQLTWSEEQWRAFVEKPAAETWVAYERGTPAGYIELDAQEEGTVEITHFGLIPAFRGYRIGGHLLSYGTARAWDLAERHPGRDVTKRVWLHTCTKDGPHAMANYQRRGFRVFDVKTEAEPTA